MLNSKFDVNRIEWLNLVFENRNQSYGAFVLRRNSGNYLSKALLIATFFFSGIIVLSAVISYKKEIVNIVTKPDVPTIFDLKDIPIPTKPIEPIKPQPKAAQSNVDNQNENVVKNLPPRVVANALATEDVLTVKQLLTKAIGSETKDGIGTSMGNITEGTQGKLIGGTGSVTNTTVFEAVEVMPEFPGGVAAWNKYLSKNLRYPPVAQENGITGRVTVSFVVEPNGEITNLKVLGAIGGGCDEEAIRVIKKSPLWKPGFQNGNAVRVSYVMPIMFQLSVAN
jgi:protein TonB